MGSRPHNPAGAFYQYFCIGGANAASFLHAAVHHAGTYSTRSRSADYRSKPSNGVLSRLGGYLSDLTSMFTSTVAAGDD